MSWGIREGKVQIQARRGGAWATRSSQQFRFQFTIAREHVRTRCSPAAPSIDYPRHKL